MRCDCSPFVAHNSQLTAHGSQLTAHRPQLTAHSPKLTVHNSQLTAHNSLISHAHNTHNLTLIISHAHTQITVRSSLKHRTQFCAFSERCLHIFCRCLSHSRNSSLNPFRHSSLRQRTVVCTSTEPYTRLSLCYSEVRLLTFRSSQLTAHGSRLTAHSPQPTAHSSQPKTHSTQFTAHSSQLTHLTCTQHSQPHPHHLARTHTDHSSQLC